MLKVGFLALFLHVSVTLFSEEITLREKLVEAPVGSYFAIEQNKNYTFLRVFDKNERSLTLEEVTIPATIFYRQHTSWKTWFENGALGNTSWTLSKIDLFTGKFEEAYSFTMGNSVDLSKDCNFLTTLLNLHFQKVPENQRRKIGLPPGYNKIDQRPVWNPRLVFEGTFIKNVPFSAWKTRWPSDGSELARKIVEIYLPEELTYPTYFPYWLEVEGKLGNARVRVVDSGTQSTSPKKMSY